MLFLKLSPSLTFLPFDTFAFLNREHLLVFDPQLSSLQLKMIHHINDSSCLFGRGEVGEGQASEDTVVEVIVEGIRQR